MEVEVEVGAVAEVEVAEEDHVLRIDLLLRLVERYPTRNNQVCTQVHRLQNIFLHMD